MKIIYISNLCTDKTFEYIKSISFSVPSLCAQKYHSVMTKGLSTAVNDKVEAVTSVSISKKTCKRKIVSLKREHNEFAEFSYVPVLNMPFLKYFFQFLGSFVLCSIKCIKYKDTVFIADMLCGSTVAGARMASKLFHKEFTGIVTDIPAFFAGEEKMSKEDKLLERMMCDCDSYVFLTEAMNELINPGKGKNYCIIEGQADFEYREPDINYKRVPPVCMYAGAIEKQYGLERLVEAFKDPDLQEYELWIYGSGSYVAELFDVCKHLTNIKYKGVKPNSEITEEEIRATILINPRPSNEEYTKYSFPSKTMEYILSGTPTVTTRLPGIPKEYFGHVFLIQDESASGIADTLKKIFNYSALELVEFGREAQKWVSENKNCVTQAQKIIKMWKE